MTWRAAAESIAGSAIVGEARLPGGDISGATRVTMADERTLVVKHGPLVETEGEMLRAIAKTGAPVPEVIGTRPQVLVMEYIEGGSGTAGDSWKALAETLLCLSHDQSAHYGWHDDYSLRHVDVINRPTADWAEFWRENRLACHLPHLDAGLARRVEALCNRLADLLPPRPAVALLHGDLWGGNIIHARDGSAVLIDPCAYIGDREVDAASLTVFDNPPRRFFEALELDAGWEDRQPVYRLWMWLVHVRLFGGSYRGAVTRELDLLGF